MNTCHCLCNSKIALALLLLLTHLPAGQTALHLGRCAGQAAWAQEPQRTPGPQPRQVRTVIGTGQSAMQSEGGPALETNLGLPFGVEVGPGGDLYVTEIQSHRVWRRNSNTDRIQAVAGSGQKGYAGDGGPATQAAMNEPYEVRFDALGHMYVVEMQNHIVRKVNARTGIITTIAGNGQAGFSGDGGPGTAAQLSVPHGICLDGQGGLYIADIGNHRVRKLDLKTGQISTIAGTGEVAPPREGANASSSPLPGPRALACDGQTLWVALREGHAIWKIDLAAQTLHHVAGTGQAGHAGDHGPARLAQFNSPKGLAVDSAKNLYVVDSGNNCVRVIEAATGHLLPWAARPTPEESLPEADTGQALSGAAIGDNRPAPDALFAQPHGICVDALGRAFVADTQHHRVRVIAEPAPQ